MEGAVASSMKTLIDAWVHYRQCVAVLPAFVCSALCVLSQRLFRYVSEQEPASIMPVEDPRAVAASSSSLSKAENAVVFTSPRELPAGLLPEPVSDQKPLLRWGAGILRPQAEATVEMDVPPADEVPDCELELLPTYWAVLKLVARPHNRYFLSGAVASGQVVFVFLVVAISSGS